MVRNNLETEEDDKPSNDQQKLSQIKEVDEEDIELILKQAKDLGIEEEDGGLEDTAIGEDAI